MKKLILGLFAALTSLIAVPTLAITPPDHVKMIVVKVGHLENGVAPIIMGNKFMKATLKNCQVGWNDNDEFYAITTVNSGIYLIPRELADYAWEASEHNWNIAFTALVQANKVCEVGSAPLS